jgi:hypothetical protein
MTEFVVAADEAWVRLFGVAPAYEGRPPDSSVRGVQMPLGDGDRSLHLTWDETDRSVRIRVRRGDLTEIDLYRELADRLIVVGHDVVVEYGEADYRGRTVVSTGPEIVVTDAILRT